MTDDLLSVMTPKQRATYMFNMYLNAEIAILNGAQSYTISGKTINRANLDEIVRQRKYWERTLSILNGGTARKIKNVHVRH
ncbi:MAG: hypothetical protein [Bacteriophage sp.]|nr:MAG: hypothetical protein [Bacteriophage sp.]